MSVDVRPKLFALMKLNGQQMVKSVLSGDPCPCVDQETNMPSEEWHRLNPTQPDCNGTGLINSSRTDTTIWAFLQEKLPEKELKQEPAGQRVDDTLTIIGAVDVGLNRVTFTDMDEKRDYIDYNGERYIVRDVKRQEYNGKVIGEVATLYRRIL